MPPMDVIQIQACLAAWQVHQLPRELADVSNISFNFQILKKFIKHIIFLKVPPRIIFIILELAHVQYCVATRDGVRMTRKYYTLYNVICALLITFFF